jgi:hypothetical protein
MTIRAALAALLLLSATAHAQLELQVPVQVGAFRRTGMQAANPGHMARYELRPGRYLDAYFYGYPHESSCGAWCDSVAVDQETASLPRLIPMLVQRGIYDRLEVRSDSVIRLPAGRGSWRGRHVAMRGTTGGADVMSHFFLVGAGEFLLKVRATHFPDPAAEAETAGFVAEMARTLADQHPDCPDGPFTGDRFGTSVEFGMVPGDVGERARAALRKLGYGVRPQEAAGQVASFTRWEWPAGVADRSGPPPGTRIVVQVTPHERGGSAAAVTATSVCRLPDGDASRQLAVDMAAMLEVVSALSEEKAP